MESITKIVDIGFGTCHTGSGAEVLTPAVVKSADVSANHTTATTTVPTTEYRASLRRSNVPPTRAIVERIQLAAMGIAACWHG
jgi:hypothetical protein